MSELLNNPDFVIFLATLVTVAYGAYVIGELRDLWYIERRCKRHARQLEEYARELEEVDG